MSWLDALSTAATPVAVAANTGQGFLNYFSEASNERWRRHAQELTWQREDNAVQRRVRDLEAAGLSPVLAAGGAASSSSPVSTAAPNLDIGALDSARLIADKVKMKADVSRTKVEEDILREQLEQERWKTKLASQEYQARSEELGTKWQLNRWLGRADLESGKIPVIEKEKANMNAAVASATSRMRELQFDVANDIYNGKTREIAAVGQYLSKIIKDFNEGKLTLQQFLAIAGTIAGGIK